jgi:hypothetical protein
MAARVPTDRTGDAGPMLDSSGMPMCAAARRRRPAFDAHPVTDRLRSSVAAFVVLCLALAGLAPSVSRVFADSRASAHDLCVADAGAPASDPSDGRRATHEAACALCLVHGGSHAAPPPAAVGRVADLASRPPPAALNGTAPARGVWLVPGPRGPPAVAPPPRAA